MELEACRFYETTLRDETWDPLTWVYLLGGGIFPLLARDFAPLADRLTSVAGRLEGVPAAAGSGARRISSGTSGRPVSRLHTETALRQLAGIDELIGDALGQADDARRRGRRRVPAAASRGSRRGRRARRWPRSRRTCATSCCRRASGEGRLGAALFAEKLRHTLKSDDDAGEIVERGPIANTPPSVPR